MYLYRPVGDCAHRVEATQFLLFYILKLEKIKSIAVQ